MRIPLLSSHITASNPVQHCHLEADTCVTAFERETERDMSSRAPMDCTLFGRQTTFTHISQGRSSCCCDLAKQQQPVAAEGGVFRLEPLGADQLIFVYIGACWDRA